MNIFFAAYLAHSVDRNNEYVAFKYSYFLTFIIHGWLKVQADENGNPTSGNPLYWDVLHTQKAYDNPEAHSLLVKGVDRKQWK